MSPLSDAPSLFSPVFEPITFAGICHVALPCADIARSLSFYVNVLGLIEDRGAQLPECGEHVVLRVPSGQRVALCRATAPLPPDNGRHIGFGVPAPAREIIMRKAVSRGIALHRYKEDRPAEESDNYYVHDPHGNRVQLVAVAAENVDAVPRVASIDHVGMQAIDLEWEEDLYVRLLGMPVEHVTGWRTSDYKRARLWGEGKEQMAPGTRRWDNRFGYVPGRVPGQSSVIARPNMQLFVKAGSQTVGLFLAFERYQLPPEERIVGVPRVGFSVDREAFDAVADRFDRAKLPVSAPHEHPRSSPYAASLYGKDRGANFLEFCCLREEAT